MAPTEQQSISKSNGHSVILEQVKSSLMHECECVHKLIVLFRNCSVHSSERAGERERGGLIVTNFELELTDRHAPRGRTEQKITQPLFAQRTRTIHVQIPVGKKPVLKMWKSILKMFTKNRRSDNAYRQQSA